MDDDEPAIKKRRLDLNGNFVRCYNKWKKTMSFPPVMRKKYEACTPSTSKCVITENEGKDLCILLRPDFQEPFIRTINYLDGQSFLNLALTSKEVHRFCMNTRGIAVSLPKGGVKACKRQFAFDWFTFSYEFSFPFTEEQIKDFHNKPVIFQLSNLNLRLPKKSEEPNFLMDFCRFLDGIRVRTINTLQIHGEIDDYTVDLINLFKTWKLKNVIVSELSEWFERGVNFTPPSEILDYFLNKVQSFEYRGTEIKGELIAESSTPKMSLPKCAIGRRELDRIIDRWMNNDVEIDCWKLSASFNETEFYDCTDPFVALPYEYDGPLPTTPPLAFYRRSIVYFYRRDWKLLGISFCDHFSTNSVNIRLCDRASYPNVLKYLLT